MAAIILGAVPAYDPIPHSGILNTIFYLTDLRIQVFGWPANGYSINLIQLIVLAVLAVVVNGVTKWLTKDSPGGLFTGVVLTIIGAYLLQAFAKIPFDFSFEGVLIVASLIGAIIVGVFYTLIRGRFKKKA